MQYCAKRAPKPFPSMFKPFPSTPPLAPKPFPSTSKPFPSTCKPFPLTSRLLFFDCFYRKFQFCKNSRIFNILNCFPLRICVLLIYVDKNNEKGNVLLVFTIKCMKYMVLASVCTICIAQHRFWPGNLFSMSCMRFVEERARFQCNSH